MTSLETSTVRAGDTPKAEVRTRAFDLVKDGLWIGLAHGLGAIATLFGLRLLTECASPSLYGSFILVNGILALLQGLLLTPIGQAALRFYTGFSSTGGVSVLRAHLRDIFVRRCAWMFVVLALGAIVDTLLFHLVSPLTWVLIAGALALEAWKTIEIVMRNAGGRQLPYAVLYAADCIARPLGAISAAIGFGASLEALLFGQSAAVLFALFLVRDRSNRRVRELASPRSTAVFADMERFARPLIWAPVLGWICGLADRYVVGGMLSIADAGIYAAAYGLASRPLLIIGTITEATLRQHLYGAATVGESKLVRTTITFWLGANVILGLGLALALSFFSPSLVRLLLAQQYRAIAATLIPWISFGYVFLLCGQVVERLLYATRRTKAVITVQAIGAAVAIVSATAGVYWYGLLGAAVAVPIYMVIQMLLTTASAALMERSTEKLFS